MSVAGRTSMTAYGKLAALNRAIAETIAILASEQDARAEIHIAVITFGGDGANFHQHIQQSRPNEDAWMGMSGAFGTAIVISDGMGSKLNARIGAQMACRAVRNALKPWAKSENAPAATLLRLVHLFWGLRVLPQKEEDSAATCVFVAVLPSGQLTIAQLGDGIAAIRNADGSLEILQGERQGFTNQTTGLGIAKTTKDWTVIAKPALSPNAEVLLATDGIADDLVADRIRDFIHTLVTEFGSMAPTARRHALHREDQKLGYSQPPR